MPIDSLRWLAFWLATGIIALAQCLLIISAVRLRQPDKNPQASPVVRSPAELAWTVATALALALLLVFIYQSLTAR
jgi:heme/copper-type cytochrome/quinol oxidase subunit 2